jgi:hypothetical protein
MHALGKYPRDVPISPPPMQAHEPSGQKGGTTCTAPKPARTNQMLPALARRSSTSAGKPRPTQKFHLCRQASPDAEVPPLPASLARRRSSMLAPADQANHAGNMPNATRDQTTAGIAARRRTLGDACARYSMSLDARSRTRTITRMTQPPI